MIAGGDSGRGRWPAGTRVRVKDRFTGRWAAGFEIESIKDEPAGYVVRRSSDGSVLPALFGESDLRAET